MLSKLVELITRLDRRIGLVVVSLTAVLLIGIPIFILTSGDDEGADGSAGAAGTGEALLGPDGLPLRSTEEIIAESVSESVAATMQAIPTPTLAPTPDVAATLQAQLAFNRDLAPAVVALDPLVREEDRSPYLTPAELGYFEEIGPRLWIHTQVWFHVRRVISVEVAEWDPEVFNYDLGRAEELLASAPDRANYSSMGEVGFVVRSYADDIETGMAGVSQAVTQLAEARSILEEEEVGAPERTRLIRISRDVEYLLDGFDEAMSSYGCSVCGELFRRAEYE